MDLVSGCKRQPTTPTPTGRFVSRLNDIVVPPFGVKGFGGANPATPKHDVGETSESQVPFLQWVCGREVPGFEGLIHIANMVVQQRHRGSCFVPNPSAHSGSVKSGAEAVCGTARDSENPFAVIHIRGIGVGYHHIPGLSLIHI